MRRIKKLEQAVEVEGVGESPLAHVSDAELQEGIDRLRRGESSGLAAKARVPEALVRAYEGLSDEELLRRADAMRAKLCGGGRRER